MRGSASQPPPRSDRFIVDDSPSRYHAIPRLAEVPVGLAITDPRVSTAVAAAGVTKTIALAPDDLAVRADMKDRGMSIGFTSELTLRRGVADLPILTSVMMNLIPAKSSKGWTPYVGPLPRGLRTTDTKDDVIARLGEPQSLSADFFSAGWLVDGLDLGVTFTSDWTKIRQLGLSLPGSL